MCKPFIFFDLGQTLVDEWDFIAHKKIDENAVAIVVVTIWDCTVPGFLHRSRRCECSNTLIIPQYQCHESV